MIRAQDKAIPSPPSDEEKKSIAWLLFASSGFCTHLPENTSDGMLRLLRRLGYDLTLDEVWWLSDTTPPLEEDPILPTAGQLRLHINNVRDERRKRDRELDWKRAKEIIEKSTSIYVMVTNVRDPYYLSGRLREYGYEAEEVGTSSVFVDWSRA